MKSKSGKNCVECLSVYSNKLDKHLEIMKVNIKGFEADENYNPLPHLSLPIDDNIDPDSYCGSCENINNIGDEFMARVKSIALHGVDIIPGQLEAINAVIYDTKITK